MVAKGKKGSESSDKELQLGRVIGIRHRVKVTQDGAAHPTEVCIAVPGKKKVDCYKLDTETDERDWVLGKYPVKWRQATEADAELVASLPEHRVELRKLRGKDEKVAFIPDEYDGLKPGDTVCMLLGSSGSLLAAAIAQRGEAIGASVMRIPTGSFHDVRTVETHEEDAEQLTLAYRSCPERFFRMLERDRMVISIAEKLRLREEVQEQRIRCGNRLMAQRIGHEFRRAGEGLDPVGTIEKAHAQILADDRVYQALVEEEGIRNRDLEKALRMSPFYTEILADVGGMGPMIAARLIACVQDIRRFTVEADLTEIARLRDEIIRLQEAAYFTTDLPNVKDEIDALVAKHRQDQVDAGKNSPEPMHPGLRMFYQVGKVAAWKRREATRVQLLADAPGCDPEDADYHRNEAKELTEGAGYLDECRNLMKRVERMKAQARNKSRARFKAYMGVHLVKDEETQTWGFARRRRGGRANWNKRGRQGLYLFTEQCMMRAQTAWGQELARYRVHFRERHPEEVMNGTRKFYGNGHIIRMARWRVASKFAEWLYDQWYHLDKRLHREQVDPPAPIPQEELAS